MRIYPTQVYILGLYQLRKKRGARGSLATAMYDWVCFIQSFTNCAGSEELVVILQPPCTIWMRLRCAYIPHAGVYTRPLLTTQEERNTQFDCDRPEDRVATYVVLYRLRRKRGILFSCDRHEDRDAFDTAWTNYECRRGSCCLPTP